MTTHKVYFNPEWMPTETRAIIFMAKVPKGFTPGNREDYLLYLPDRYDQLCIEAKRAREVPEEMAEEILGSRLFLPSSPTDREITLAIMNSDVYCTWKARFLDEEEQLTPEITRVQAMEIYRENSLSLLLESLALANG